MLDGIVAEAAKQGVRPREDDELARTVSALRFQLKALVARDLWDMNEYFRVFNEHSDIVREGLKEIS